MLTHFASRFFFLRTNCLALALTGITLYERHVQVSLMVSIVPSTSRVRSIGMCLVSWLLLSSQSISTTSALRISCQNINQLLSRRVVSTTIVRELFFEPGKAGDPWKMPYDRTTNSSATSLVILCGYAESKGWNIKIDSNMLETSRKLGSVHK